MRCGIADIGVHLPAQALDPQELGTRLQADPAFIRTKLGFERLLRKPREEFCSDLCVHAYNELARRRDFANSPIEAIIVVTQNPDGGGIPHASALVHRKLAARPEVACFDISLGCTGYVHGLSIALGFLRDNDLAGGLLFTADPYSQIINVEDRDTVLLFGDAATCTYLCRQPVFEAGRTVYCTDSRAAEAICVAKRGGQLRMDGNQVFRFVVRSVPQLIQQCLERNRLTQSDVDLFLVHQGSRYIVDTLRDQLKVSPERMPFATEQTGNTVSSTIPQLLQPYLNSKARRIVVVGFGVGLAAAATVLYRGGNDEPR